MSEIKKAVDKAREAAPGNQERLRICVILSVDGKTPIEREREKLRRAIWRERGVEL